MHNRSFLSGNTAVIECYNWKTERYFYVIVDREDFELIEENAISISVHVEYYTQYANYHCSKDKRTKRLHRLIMKTPKELVVDHINHNGLDNRRANLRNCTSSENQKNRRLAVPKHQINYQEIVSENVWRCNIKAPTQAEVIQRREFRGRIRI